MYQKQAFKTWAMIIISSCCENKSRDLSRESEVAKESEREGEEAHRAGAGAGEGDEGALGGGGGGGPHGGGGPGVRQLVPQAARHQVRALAEVEQLPGRRQRHLTPLPCGALMLRSLTHAPRKTTKPVQQL